jgi:Type II restriction endonuclease EcoO109I
MDAALREEVTRFVETTIVSFHENRAKKIEKLKLSDLLRNKNPYLFKAKHLESGPDLVRALLDARLSSSEEGSFGSFLEELAIFVASQAGAGKKSAATGIDIELVRDECRYIIAVKSGKNWGNASQHAALKKNFETAVKVLNQSKQAGRIQPTLGICYGKFKTVNNGVFLHIGGQSFWELLSGDPGLYVDIVEPLGHRAGELNAEFDQRKTEIYNRMTREFLDVYRTPTDAIDWQKLVEYVSRNFD